MTDPNDDGSKPNILVIKQPWLDFILSGEKTWEVRNKPCKMYLGRRIFLGEFFGGQVFRPSDHI